MFSVILFFYYYAGLYLFDKQRIKKKFNKKVILIVPTYNENEEQLINTIQAAKKAKGIDKILFVNDGSKNNVSKVFKKYLNTDEYIDNKHNQGKRDAQNDAINYIIKHYGKDYFEVIVFMDSDTILLENSIIELTNHMWDKEIGGVTAQILCKNKDDNLLTKCISAMYWSSSNIWRKAPSNYGYQQVTNGQLSCYRAKPIIELMPDYTNQYWFDRKCSMSDDRWLTQQIQIRYNLKIIYEENAIAYTYIPNTISSAYKMFLRWKKGSLRETILVSKHIFKKPLIVLDAWWNNLIALFQVIVRVWLIYLFFIYPPVIFWYLLTIVIISIIYGFDMLIRNPKEMPYRVGYSILNEFIFGWVIIHGIYDIKNQGKWITR